MISTLIQASETFTDAAISLSITQVGEPSLLPGWSRGHVVAHVVLNAEGFIEVAQALNAAQPALMYPAGAEARDSAIDDLARAPIEQLLLRLDSANTQFLQWWDPEPPTGPAATAEGHPTFASTTVLQRRIRELQVHLVDLNLDGFGIEDWTNSFVNADLELQWPTVAHRTSQPVRVVDERGTEWSTGANSSGLQLLQVERRRLLGWVLDRCAIETLPALEAWSNPSRWEHLADSDRTSDLD